MIKMKVTLIIVFFISINVIAQQEKKEIRKDKNNKVELNPVEQFNITYDDFKFIRELNKKKIEILSSKNKGDVWLRTSLELKNSLLNYNNPEALPSDILDPLYRKYKEDQEFSIVQYVLGTAQAAAVGYLAYKHIEKYGLFK